MRKTDAGRLVETPTFREFLTRPWPEGIASTPEAVQRCCRDDPEALRRLRGALKGRPNPEGVNQYRRGSRNNVTITTTGNTRAYALDWLATHREDLYRRVLAGTVSAHQAMRQAGKRRATFTAPDDPDALARVLQRRWTVQQRKRLVALLTEA